MITQQYYAFLKRNVHQEAGFFRVGTLLTVKVMLRKMGHPIWESWYVLRLWTFCLKVSETCICSAASMLGKQSAVHLITEGMHRMAFLGEWQSSARDCQGMFIMFSCEWSQGMMLLKLYIWNSSHLLVTHQTHSMHISMTLLIKNQSISLFQHCGYSNSYFNDSFITPV